MVGTRDLEEQWTQKCFLEGFCVSKKGHLGASKLHHDQQ